MRIFPKIRRKRSRENSIESRGLDTPATLTGGDQQESSITDDYSQMSLDKKTKALQKMMMLKASYDSKELTSQQIQSMKKTETLEIMGGGQSIVSSKSQFQSDFQKN